MLFWVRNLPLFSGLCKWDVTRYIYNLGIFSSIFNIFQFLHYSKRQHSYFLLNCNHQRSKMTSLKTICPLLIKIFSIISEQPWMGVMIMLQVNNKLYFFQWYQLPHSFCLFPPNLWLGHLNNIIGNKLCNSIHLW